jgi:hypothetical protein
MGSLCRYAPTLVENRMGCFLRMIANFSACFMPFPKVAIASSKHMAFGEVL